jgi:hypothetical protein
MRVPIGGKCQDDPRDPDRHSSVTAEYKRDAPGATSCHCGLSPGLAGCGKSRDFGKTVMKRARNGNLGLIKSTGYEGAKGDELGWKHH